MFVNKKNSLPPRPQVPNHEHILEDLEKAGVDDVAFKIINDLCVKDGSMDSNSSDIYKKVKTYLNTKQQLKQLESTLKKEEQQMHTDNEEIKRLADDIRKQAEAALNNPNETYMTRHNNNLMSSTTNSNSYDNL